jgi:cytochrome P450
MPGPTFYRSFTHRIGQSQKIVSFVNEHNIMGDFIFYWYGPILVVLATDPESAKFVLKESRLEKAGILHAKISRRFKQKFGQDILSSNGELWRKHRLFANPGFSDDSLSYYLPTMIELADKSIATISPAPADQNVFELLSRFTLDVLGKTIFNYDFKRIEGENDKYYRAYKSIIGLPCVSTLLMMMASLPFIEKLPFKSVREFHHSIDVMEGFFLEMIEETKKHPSNNCILSRLIEGVEKDQCLSNVELMSDIWIFFLAGHDTTSIALTWACRCMVEYPVIQEKLYSEIIEKIGTERIPTEKEFNEMVYLNCFIQEVLRLHTPVPSLTSRIATEDIKYKDQLIPKGARVGLLFHHIHTHPLYWDDPQTFNPDRFLPEERKGRNHFMHVPFSTGPRQCIGTNFSLNEQRVFLIRLLQKYRLVRTDESKMWPMESMIQINGDQYNIPLKFIPR